MSPCLVGSAGVLPERMLTSGWPDVNLSHVRSEKIAELVHAAWGEVAPKRTIAKSVRERHPRRGHGP
jgi:hypothetical protein